jgi:trehalose/maltose hydrolase-like predicted phosphorylase
MTDTWLLTEDRIRPELVPWKESLFSIANGYLGTKGSFEEGYRGSVPATFMHGLFVTTPGALPYLCPLPDWTGCSITVDGVRFRLDQQPPVGYERVLDMRTGVLTRRVLWRGPGTGLIRAEFRRLVSMASPELASLEITITSLTDDVQIEVETGLDGSVTSPRGEAWASVDWELTGRGRLAMTARTEDQVSVTATTIVHGSDSLGLVEEPRHPRLTTTADLATGERLVLVKHTTYQRGSDSSAPTLPSESFDSIATASAAKWSRRWETSNIEVSGDRFAEGALRFAAFHLIGAAPRGPAGGIGARLLSGYGYMHHVFWDTDVFVVPYLTLTQPDLARAHLGYRYRGLDGARKKAAYYGRSGAFYAWESAETGDECTPEWGATPEGDRVRIRTGEIEEHIVADVAYALDHYLTWVGDTQFLRDHGAEMSIEGARYWHDRVEVDEKGRGHLRNVIGPNEYHVGVDDNFFTNAMAAWHLRAAVRHAAALKNLDESQHRDLVSRLGLATGWETSFLDLAESVAPHRHPDGIFEEHEGYFALDEVDLTGFEPRRSSMQAILGEKAIARGQITKQADVVMGLVLLEQYQDPDVVAAQLDYYAPRTDHGSSLSLAIHSIAASIGMRPDQAYSFFRAAADIDLDDSMGNGDHGIHGATQGGLLQAALLGFGGLHLTEDGPHVSPRLPDHWESLGFSFVYRGTRFEREVRADKPAREATASRADHNRGG